MINQSLPPTGLLVALLGIFWLGLTGVIWPHPWRGLPILVPAAMIGALLGQAAAAVAGGIGPTFGDVQPIGVALGSLLALGVVRRITA